MANTSKSTKKTAKRASTTSSGSRSTGTRGTNSRTKTTSRNASREDENDYAQTARSQSSLDQGEDLNYDDDYRNAHYRGMTNEGEEGDLGSRRSSSYNRGSSSNQEYRENWGRDSMDHDRSYYRGGDEDRRSGWGSFQDDEDQMRNRGRNRGSQSWSYDSGRNRPDYDSEFRNPDRRSYRDWSNDDYRNQGHNQEPDYQRNWSAERRQSMPYGNERRPTSYQQNWGSEYDSAMSDYDSDRRYSRQGYGDHDTWSGQRSSYGDGMRYGASQGVNYDMDRYGSGNQSRNRGDHYGSDWSERNWRSGNQGSSGFDDDRNYGSRRGPDQDRDWPQRNREYDEGRFSSNRGDYGSDWRGRTDYDDDWRSGQRYGRRNRSSWEDRNDDRDRRNRNMF